MALKTFILKAEHIKTKTVQTWAVAELSKQHVRDAVVNPSLKIISLEELQGGQFYYCGEKKGYEV